MELPPVFQREFVIAVRRAQLAAERHARRFFPVLGVLFLLIGCFYADFIRQFPRMLRALLGILPFFTFALPLVLWNCLCLLHAVKCPHCGFRLRRSGPAVALHRCPRCYGQLFRPESFKHLDLPSAPRPVKLSLNVGSVLCLSVLIILFRLSPVIRPSFDLLVSWPWWLNGVFLLLFPLLHFGIGKLPLPQWKRKRCPVCGEFFDSESLRYTGNCSVCGSGIDPDWPPPEPEPGAELPALTAYAHYRKLLNRGTTTGIIFFLFCECSFSWIVQHFLPFEILNAVLFLASPMLLLIGMFLMQQHLQHRHSILETCPYCTGRSRWLKFFAVATLHRTYLRCTVCRRKLVQMPDDGERPIRSE